MRLPGAGCGALVIAALGLGCQQVAKPTASGQSGGGAVAEARTLIEQGQLDQALAKLQEAAADAERLHYQGVVWAKKAAAAPAPTAPPAPSPLPRGAEPAEPPELKPEELQAVALFERAVAAGHGASNAALADLLAPHAIHWHEKEEAAAKKHPQHGPSPTPQPAPSPDYTPQRVVALYRSAAQADTSSRVPLEALTAFCRKVKLLEDADAGFQELVARDRQDADALMRYGEFLFTEKKDYNGAVAQYNQVLIWKPGDSAARTRIAEVYLQAGEEALAQQQYGTAEGAFKRAGDFISDGNSPAYRRMRDNQDKLKALRSGRR